MTRKLAITALLILGCASVLLAKIKAEDQAFFDGKFQEITEQTKALKVQQDALAAQLKQLADTQKAQTDALSDLAKNQSRFQTAVDDLQRIIGHLGITISTVGNNNTQDTALLKQEIDQLRAQVQLIGGGGGVSGPKPPAVGYVTAVTADNMVTVNLGSGNGLKTGSQLGLFKATDPNTRVGTLEVTDVIDQGNAHASVKILNAGVKPEYSDMVKPD